MQVQLTSPEAQKKRATRVAQMILGFLIESIALFVQKANICLTLEFIYDVYHLTPKALERFHLNNAIRLIAIDDDDDPARLSAIMFHFCIN